MRVLFVVFFARNKEIQCNSVGQIFFRHARRSARLCLLFFSRVTVEVSLAFTVQVTHAAMKFAQEQIKHMIYYLHGDIFRQTQKQ